MPLVQSLDILRQRVTNPVFKAVLDDVYERVRSGSALSEAFEAHGALFPGVYTASLLAGEKSGNLEQVLRRYVSYVKIVSSVKRKTISALVYPGDPGRCSRSCVVTIIVVKVVPEFGNVLQPVRQGAAAVDAGDRRPLGVRDDVLLLILAAIAGGASRRLRLGEATRPAAAVSIV